jgi:tetratricopeptide (TPR) repeat protein
VDPITTTIEDLLLGRPVDRGAWLSIASQLSAGRSEEEDALLAVAQVATAGDVRGLDHLVSTIAADYKLAWALGRAIAASRCLDATDAASLNALVHSTLGLLPYLQEQTLVRPAFQHLARMQARAIEISKDPLDLAAVCDFAYLANTLAKQMDDPGHLKAALAVADRLHHCAAGPNRCLAVMSLLPTCKELARYEPSEAEGYLLRGVELASDLHDASRELAHMFQHPRDAHLVALQALRNLVAMHAELFETRPMHSAQHAAAARRHASHLQELAEESGDLDLRQEAAQIQDFLLDRLGPAPGSRPGGEAAPPRSAEALLKHIATTCLNALDTVNEIRSLPAGEARNQAVEEHVQRLYVDLASALRPAVQEIGINRHVSRLLLALGAIASGRLWPLARPAVQASLLQTPPLEQGTSPRHMLERSQEVASRRMFDLELNYPAQICAIATLSDELSYEDDLAGVLKEVLRRENRKLLERVLPAAQPQHVAGRRLSMTDDLAGVLTLLRPGARRRAPGPSPAGASDRTEGCPCGSGQSFSQCHGAEEGTAEAAEPLDELDPPTRELEFDPGPDGSQPSLESPESMVGLTGRIGGDPFKIESIIGMGTKKAVFSFVNLRTGARTAFKFYLSSFGPKGALNAHLNALNEGKITPDPDKMISLCDEVIARAPRDEVAWANKGAALFMKQELTSALEAFDRALAIDPDHLNSLFYKATSYALLCQHSEAIRHVARASHAHPEGLRKLLLGWNEAKKALAASALAVLRDDPDRGDVRQLFVEHFL